MRRTRKNCERCRGLFRVKWNSKFGMPGWRYFGGLCKPCMTWWRKVQAEKCAAVGIETPRFKHDCDGCEYLGRHGKFDLYYCANCDRGSVIARYSSRGDRYASSMVPLIDRNREDLERHNSASMNALIEAVDRVKARNLRAG